MDVVSASFAENKSERLSIHHVSKGLKYLEAGKLGKAETHFLKAVEYNPRSAAAHNNLGSLKLSRHELYDAAWEFQRAAELAPNSTDPIINLGLVHDEADQLLEAATYYTQALERNPNDPVALGNLVRTRIKLDDDPASIHNMLKHLIFIDTRAEWVGWAEVQLATKYKADAFPFPINSTGAATPAVNSPSVVTPMGESLPPSVLRFDNRNESNGERSQPNGATETSPLNPNSAPTNQQDNSLLQIAPPVDFYAPSQSLPNSKPLEFSRATTGRP